MASSVLLLFASVLLGSPGLAFSSLIPESYEASMATLYDGEQLYQGLAQEGPQGNLLATGMSQGISCRFCKKIIQDLQQMVGEQPDEEAIAQAVSRVCNKAMLLKGFCKKVMKKFLKRITQDISDGKPPHTICVDISLCKSQAGLL